MLAKSRYRETEEKCRAGLDWKGMEELGRKKSRLGGRLGGTHAQASKQTLPTAPNTTRTYGLPGISQLIGRGTLGFNYLALLFTFLNSKQTLTQQLNSGENGCQMCCFSWWSRVGRDSWLAFVRIVWAAPSTTTNSSPRWLWLTDWWPRRKSEGPQIFCCIQFPSLSLCPHSYRSREARRHSQPVSYSLHSFPHKEQRSNCQRGSNERFSESMPSIRLCCNVHCTLMTLVIMNAFG